MGGLEALGRERRREAWLDWTMVAATVHISLAVLAFGPANSLIDVIATATLALGFAMGGVISLHHAAHRRFGRSWSANIIAVHLSAPTGFWVRQWAAKHQVHHKLPAVYPDDAFTNVGGGILRLHPSAPVRQWHRYQPVYAWFLYAFSWLADLISQVRFLLAEAFSDTRAVEKSKWVSSFLLEKAMALLVLSPYVFLCDDPVRLAKCSIAGILFAGLLAACLVAVGHVNTGLTISVVGTTDWTSHVLATTASFSVDGRLTPLLFGGLTHHAAHHMRPTASRRELRDLHSRLQCTDKAHMYPLIEFATFRSALRGHVKVLCQLGSAPTEVPSGLVHRMTGSSR